MTYNDWLITTTKRLQATSHTARLDADVLLGVVTGKTKAHILAYIDTQLATSQLQELEILLKRRLNGEPMAYITGQAEFYGHLFCVNKQVLVPRPESESFLDMLQDLRKTERVHNLIDIGTGSGALAIAVKLAHPDMYVTATDISKAALMVASSNILSHKAPVTLRKQSLLTNDKEGYDVVLANLPYVPTGTPSSPSIAHEPDIALFSGHDGLGHYTRLFKQLGLKHIRFVMTESLLSQHKAVQALAKSANYTLAKTDGLVQLFIKIPEW
jgi:release factor glutamine methyltransferase